MEKIADLVTIRARRFSISWREMRNRIMVKPADLQAFSKGPFSKSNDYETHKLQLSGHFIFLIACYMGRNIWFVICEVQTPRNL